MSFVTIIRKSKYSPYVLLLCVFLITYWKLPLTFYQQDEWAVVGHFFSEGILAQISTEPLLQLLTGNMRVLSHPLHILFYYVFPLQIMPLVIFASIMHCLNSFLVFHLTDKVTKNYLIAIISGVFFAVSSTASQSITWAGASTTTLPSAFFTFLAILFYIHYLEKRKNQKAFLAFLFAITAYLFKESSIFLLLFFPLLHVLFSAKNNKLNLKLHITIIAYFVFAVVVRILNQVLSSDVSMAGRVATDSSIISKFLYFSWIYPLSAIVQYIIPLREMFQFALRAERINYPFIANTNLSVLVAERIVADLISLLLSIGIVGFFIFLSIKVKQYRKIIIFSLSLIFFSMLPFSILEKANAYHESRYYYIGTFGVGILLGVLVDYVFTFLKRYNNIPVKIRYVPLMLLLAFFYLQIHSVHRDFELQIMLAKVRTSFIQDLKQTFPNLPDKPVFYITGDETHYGYNHYVPFQQGLGYTLMVLYYSTGKIPSDFLTENFLWDVGSEGYKEVGGKGFGYFVDKKTLAKLVKNDTIKPEQIIALEYKTKEKKLINRTSVLRREISEVQ